MGKFHGKNALIYISGTTLVGANAWAVTISQGAAETPEFGDTWISREVGMADWSGSLGAWMYDDSKVITNAATAGVAVALLIYPKRADLTEYFSGNAIFGAALGGGVAAAANRDSDFVGAGALTIAGFPS